MIWQPHRNRVVARGQPQPFPLSRLAPGQVAGRAHQAFKDFRKMPRMQHDQTHAGPNLFGHAFHHRIINLSMCSMAPPQKHIGLRQSGSGQPMLCLLQRCRGGRDRRITVQRISDAVVHAFGVKIRHNLVGLLMHIFAPDNRAYRHSEFSDGWGRTYRQFTKS